MKKYIVNMGMMCPDDVIEPFKKMGYKYGDIFIKGRMIRRCSVIVSQYMGGDYPGSVWLVFDEVPPTAISFEDFIVIERARKLKRILSIQS